MVLHVAVLDYKILFYIATGMNCKNPILIKDKSGQSPHGIYVPCGRCLFCRIQKRNEWTLRLFNELQYHDHSSFYTLTYNDENLPENGSIRKRDLQLFFKRLRKAGKDFKYFASGEYGDRTGRPHYHLILFGVSANDDDANLVRKIWDKGFVYPGRVEINSIQYVAQYTTKKLYGKEKEKRLGDKKENVFSLMSKGLGKKFAIEEIEKIKKGYLTLNGKRRSIPRYYLKILDGLVDKNVMKERAIELEKERVEQVVGLYNTVNDLLSANAIKEYTKYIQRLYEHRKIVNENLEKSIEIKLDKKLNRRL